MELELKLYHTHMHMHSSKVIVFTSNFSSSFRLYASFFCIYINIHNPISIDSKTTILLLVVIKYKIPDTTVRKLTRKSGLRCLVQTNDEKYSQLMENRSWYTYKSRSCAVWMGRDVKLAARGI
jgi:hypothetical protein